VFQHQAASTPDARAVVFDGETLTYRDLDERANRLANHLVRMGVVPGDLVGLCLARGIESVVGMLGVMKAGAAYLPLDPTYPPDRLSFMLDDSALSLVITTTRIAGHLPSTGVPVVLCDTDYEEESAQAPDVAVAPDDLAYVMYTSGSTGTPRGARVRH